MAWISGNRRLNADEQKNNAYEVRRALLHAGWTLNAICGVMGNLQAESTINPGIWENLEPFVGGYGLVQWTPYTKYSNWAGPDWENNGPRQVDRIVYEANTGIQWGSNPYAPEPDPPMTFKEFTQSLLDPEELARLFLTYYERPAELNQPMRSKWARDWFTLFTTPYDRRMLLLAGRYAQVQRKRRR